MPNLKKNNSSAKRLAGANQKYKRHIQDVPKLKKNIIPAPNG